MTMTDPCDLGALLAAAIDYGSLLGRLSSDLEPGDVVQTQAALDRARARMVELRKALRDDPMDGTRETDAAGNRL